MQPNRRQVITALASASIGGIIVSTVGTETTSASSLSIDGLELNGTTDNLDGELTDIIATVEITYSYELNTELTERRFVLQAGTPEESPITIDNHSDANPEQKTSGTKTLTKSILISPRLEKSGFNPLEGETIEKKVVITVKLELLNDEVIETKEITDTATVTITRANDVINMDISGSGELDVQQN